MTKGGRLGEGRKAKRCSSDVAGQHGKDGGEWTCGCGGLWMGTVAGCWVYVHRVRRDFRTPALIDDIDW